MKTEISNFAGTQTIVCEAEKYSTCGLVRIVQFGGSMHFQFDMTPEQALELAAALKAGAEEICAEKVAA